VRWNPADATPQLRAAGPDAAAAAQRAQRLELGPAVRGARNPDYTVSDLALDLEPYLGHPPWTCSTSPRTQLLHAKARQPAAPSLCAGPRPHALPHRSQLPISRAHKGSSITQASCGGH